MKRISVFLVALVGASALLVLDARLDAHHSASVFFDRDRIMTIKGVVTKWSFTNPHPALFVEAPDENGNKVEWLLQFTNVLNMRRLGVTPDTFAVGMEVSVTGPRSVAEGTFALNPELVVLPNGTEIRAAPGQPAEERGITRQNQ